jgi:hypothetical protein
MSGWFKTGLQLFNPERVLKDIQKPEVNVALVCTEIEKPCDFLQPQLETLKTAESLMSLHRRIEEGITKGRELNSPCKIYIQKLANAAENAFAD